MIYRNFHCPSCDEFGFLDITGDQEVKNLVDSICHYCGHVLTASELAEQHPGYDRETRPNRLSPNRLSRRGVAPRR